MTNAYMRLSSTVSHHGLNPCAPSEWPLICLLSSPAMAAMAPSLFHSQLRKLRTASCRWCTPRRAHKVVLKIDWKKVQIRNVGKTPKAALRQRKRGGSGLHSTNSPFPLRRSLEGSEEGVERQQGEVSHVFMLCKVISARKENSSLALLQRGAEFYTGTNLLTVGEERPRDYEGFFRRSDERRTEEGLGNREKAIKEGRGGV